MAQHARRSPTAAPDLGGLGGLVRRHREDAGLSLRALAQRLGVSASLLSRIENGKARPSVTTLYGLTSELGLSLDELSGAPAPQAPDAGAGAARLSTAVDRLALPMGAGVTWDILESSRDRELELLGLVYEAGASSSEDGSLVTHAGRETGYVISGRLLVVVGDDTYDLGPGDSLSFESDVPHRFWNPGPDRMRAVWLNIGRGAGGASRIPG